MMDPSPASGARGLHLLERLRADIVGGRFPPDSPLRVSVLAERYETSMSLVREALVRLAEQHLAVLTPNAGFRTAPVSREDLIHLTDLRVHIEPHAVDLSVRHGDLAWEADLIGAHHVLERTPAKHDDVPGSTDEWATAHAAFHDALIAACGNPRLLTLTRSLRDSAELYRQLSEAGGTGAHRDVAGEHRELLALAVARDSTDAAAALERHLRTTSQLILDTVLAEDDAPRGRAPRGARRSSRGDSPVQVADPSQEPAPIDAPRLRG